MTRICKARGCEARIRADNRVGYCMAHRRHRVCAHDGCDNPIDHDNKSGFCVHHFQRPSGYKKRTSADVLGQLNDRERADYRLVKRVMGYSQAEALRAIKRPDLAGEG